MNKKARPTKRTSHHQKTTAKREPESPYEGCALPEFTEKIGKLGIDETRVLEVLHQMGFLYDAPGMPWHNLPTPMSIENGLMALVPVEDQAEGTSELNHDVNMPVESSFQGRSELRIEGGTAGELLHAWHLYQERTREDFID